MVELSENNKTKVGKHININSRKILMTVSPKD